MIKKTLDVIGETKFTDDDLKRLKEGLAAHVKFTDGKGVVFRPRVHLDADELSALLSRLEAAEAVLNYFQSRGEDQHYPEAGFRAWRKACGK